GLRSELVSPLLLGARPIGMLTLARDRPDAFSEDEVELVSLLGSLVATAVQNIRAYEAERRRVEELGRLSQLRADFVSLVSHELRSPMAAVLAQQDVPVVASVVGRLPAIRGDRARLRQVLGNLIENAVKYSPEGGEVRVSAAAGNGAVRIAVRDLGPGIPRHQQSRIFEK